MISISIYILPLFSWSGTTRVSVPILSIFNLCFSISILFFFFTTKILFLVIYFGDKTNLIQSLRGSHLGNKNSDGSPTSLTDDLFKPIVVVLYLCHEQLQPMRYPKASRMLYWRPLGKILPPEGASRHRHVSYGCCPIRMPCLGLLLSYSAEDEA